MRCAAGPAQPLSLPQLSLLDEAAQILNLRKSTYQNLMSRQRWLASLQDVQFAGRAHPGWDRVCCGCMKVLRGDVCCFFESAHTTATLLDGMYKVEQVFVWV